MTIEAAREKLTKVGLPAAVVSELLPDHPAPTILLTNMAEAARIGYLDQLVQQLKELADFFVSSTDYAPLGAYLEQGCLFLFKLYAYMMAQAVGDMVMNGARYDKAYKEYKQAKADFKDKGRASVERLTHEEDDAARISLAEQFLAALDDWEELRWVNIEEHKKFEPIKARYVERQATLQPKITAPDIDEAAIPTMIAIQQWAKQR